MNELTKLRYGILFPSFMASDSTSVILSSTILV